MQIILKSRDLWNVVSKKELPPKADDKNQKLLAAYEKKDITAERILVTTLGDQPLSHVVTCNSASEMWTKLQSVFEQSIPFLQQKFFVFEKSDDDDIASFISVGRNRKTSSAILIL